MAATRAISCNSCAKPALRAIYLEALNRLAGSLFKGPKQIPVKNLSNWHLIVWLVFAYVLGC